MDPVTHALSGSVWSRVGFYQRWGMPAILVILGASLLPDIDHFVFDIAGPFAYLKYHRGFTHSVIGALPMALAFSALTFFLIRDSRRMGYARIVGLSLIGISTHIILDLLTSYGTQILFPFSNHRFALDIIFIIDPYLSSIFVLSLIVTHMARKRERRIAVGALVLAVTYILFAGINHSLAIKKGEALAKERGIEGIKTEALPLPLSPFRWMVITEDRTRYHQTEVDLLNGTVLTESYDKGPWDDERVRKAGLRDEIQTYLWFARYPVVEIKGTKEGYSIEYTDLRFGMSPTRRPFQLVLNADSNGKVSEISIMIRRPAGDKGSGDRGGIEK